MNSSTQLDFTADPAKLTDPAQLVAVLTRYNDAYRAGTPLVDDLTYDALVERLRGLDPRNDFLSTVEPEALDDGKTQVRHARPMLSTEKAYTREHLRRFVDRVEKAAAEIGVTAVTFRVTPKLDGLAGNDVDGVLASRGNGRIGSDITNAFKKGLVAIGGRNQGLGEIVIQQSYFEANFSDIFEHPRNMAVGIIKADNVNAQSQKALDDKKVHFVPYTQLPSWTGSGDSLVNDIGEITEELRGQVDYALDGMVAQATDAAVQAHMGATSHHYRWQIAIKERGETARTTIKDIIWQTGRTGNVTPVLLIDTVRLSGANINRVTAHHAGMVRDKKLGVGAEIEIIRSGEVIPKLETVHKTADVVALPDTCPSCGEPLEWQNDFLNCGNRTDCPAQVVSGIRHWFKTLGTADWYGEKTITRLVAGGINSLQKVYAMTKEDVIKLDFGEGQTKNLIDALTISRQQPVEDARFLAAFGIKDLGVGDSRKLLRNFKLESLGELTAEQLEAVKGFGKVTSVSITKGLQRRWKTIQHMLDLGFNLEHTPLESERKAVDSPIAGKRVMFTGKMLQGTRDDMKTQAMALGATVASSISKKLNILVAGERASSGKLTKARNAGVTVMTEAEYLKLLSGEA
ncbi:MAG: BRCT domain-containing protein [Myxococcota bacterium]